MTPAALVTAVAPHICKIIKNLPILYRVSGKKPKNRIYAE